MKFESIAMTLLWLCAQLIPGNECRRLRGRKQTGLSSSATHDTTYSWCSPCEISHCPIVTSDMCSGSIVKDWCNCCPICIGASDSHASIAAAMSTATSRPAKDHVTTHTDQSEACVKITCAKFQVCMLNIQGIPMCRCPTKFWCMKGERNPVCGQNDVTYKSKCFLRMAECEAAQNIPIKHKGKCFKSEKDRKIKLERQKQKELKNQQKREKKKIKLEKMERKMKKDAKREKKQRKKQRRRSKNKRWVQKTSRE